MHELFNSPESVQYGIPRFGGQQWVREGFRRNVRQAADFYHHNAAAVASDHFLVRLLGSIDVALTHNLERYYDLVDSLALNLSVALKMTSSISAGHFFPGVFYGPESSEILLAHTADFDFQATDQHWREAEAIKVLRMPRSDLGLNLPDGQASGTEAGLAVVAINIPMLAVQYRAFRADQQASVGSDSQKSIAQFVHMYVLPNMLWSQTDQALFNRLLKIARGEELGQSLKHHSFAMPAGYSDKLTDLLVSVLYALRRQSLPFEGMLAAIPAVSAASMKEVMRLPAMAQTRQVVWALTIARLPALNLLFREAFGGAGQRNQSDINQIERTVRALRYGHTLQQYVPAQLLPQVQQEIAEIIQLHDSTPS